MGQQQFINSAKQMLIKGYEDDSIVYYLKEDGAKPDEIPSIIETAKAEFYEEGKLDNIKKNKIFYYMWILLTICSFIVFLFIIPLADTTGNTFILSFLGAVLCSFFGFHAYIIEAGKVNQ